MYRKGLILLLGLSLCGMAGCGGNSSGSKSASTSKAAIKMHTIASARLMRATFAIAGLGRPITRAANGRTLQHSELIAAALHHTRDVSQGQDAGTKLYYTLTANADGSGREDLFTDGAHTQPAGNIVWGVPTWNNNQPDSYPAIIHATYSLTAGDFAGSQGTLDITVKSANDASKIFHVVLKNAKKESCDANFDIEGDTISGQENGTLGDGSTYSETDKSEANGGLQSTVVFSDNSSEVLDAQVDGPTHEIISAPGGMQEASATLNDDGEETVSYDDGSSDSFDVDTDDDYGS